MRQRVGLLSLALLVGTIVAAARGAHGAETVLLLALAACGFAYLALLVRERRKEPKP